MRDYLARKISEYEHELYDIDCVMAKYSEGDSAPLDYVGDISLLDMTLKQLSQLREEACEKLESLRLQSQ